MKPLKSKSIRKKNYVVPDSQVHESSYYVMGNTIINGSIHGVRGAQYDEKGDPMLTPEPRLYKYKLNLWFDEQEDEDQ